MRNLSLFHAALADENRLRLLHLMKGGEICVCYLQEVLQTNQPRISRHLAYLKKAGLVEARRDGKWMHYRLKKLGPGMGTILTDTLKHLEKEPQIKKDAQRLKQIICCPERYGISPIERMRTRLRQGYGAASCGMEIRSTAPAASCLAKAGA